MFSQWNGKSFKRKYKWPLCLDKLSLHIHLHEKVFAQSLKLNHTALILVLFLYASRQ